MKLIDNWKQAWKLRSMQISALFLALPDAYNVIAMWGWVDQMPAPAMWTIRLLAALSVLARITKQKSLSARSDAAEADGTPPHQTTAP